MARNNNPFTLDMALSSIIDTSTTLSGFHIYWNNVYNLKNPPRGGEESEAVHIAFYSVDDADTPTLIHEDYYGYGYNEYENFSLSIPITSSIYKLRMKVTIDERSVYALEYFEISLNDTLIVTADGTSDIDGTNINTQWNLGGGIGYYDDQSNTIVVMAKGADWEGKIAGLAKNNEFFLNGTFASDILFLDGYSGE